VESAVAKKVFFWCPLILWGATPQGEKKNGLGSEQKEGVAISTGASKTERKDRFLFCVRRTAAGRRKGQKRLEREKGGEGSSTGIAKKGKSIPSMRLGKGASTRRNKISDGVPSPGGGGEEQERAPEQGEVCPTRKEKDRFSSSSAMGGGGRVWQPNCF